MSWEQFALKVLASALGAVAGAVISKLILPKLEVLSLPPKFRATLDSFFVVGKLRAVNRLILFVPLIAVLIFVQSTDRDSWLTRLQDPAANSPAYDRETPSSSTKARVSRAKGNETVYNVTPDSTAGKRDKFY